MPDHKTMNNVYPNYLLVHTKTTVSNPYHHRRRRHHHQLYK